MMKVERSVIINKPVGDVFAFTQSMENYTKWQGDVDSVKMEKGPDNNVGSTYTEVRKVLGKELKTTLEITAYKEKKKWAAKVVKGPVPYEVTMSYESIPQGTKIITTVEGEPKGFFKLAEGMVAKSIEDSLEKDFEMLKKLLE